MGQGISVLEVGTGGVVRFLLSRLLFYLLFPSVLETTNDRLKYCLKGPLTLNNKPVFPVLLSF